MKKKRLSLIFMIICYVLATGYSLLILFTAIFNRPIKEEETVLYTGTVVFVSSNAGDENHLCKIKLQEYNAELLIFRQDAIIDKTKFNNLKADDVVEFRIAKVDSQTLEDKFYVDVLSLNTADGDILTLESYNLSVLKDIRLVSIVGVVVVSFFTVLGIILNNIFIKQKMLLKMEEQKREYVEQLKSQT